MTFTSWQPTLPPIRPPQVSAGQVVAGSGTGGPGGNILADPFFGSVTSQTGIASLSTASPTGYVNEDGGAMSPGGWYLTEYTTGLSADITYSTSVQEAGLPSLNIFNSSHPPIMRPWSYDLFVDGSTSGYLGGAAAMGVAPMYYEFQIDIKTGSTNATPLAGLQMRFANWDGSTHGTASTAEMVATEAGTTGWQTYKVVGTIPEFVPGSTIQPVAHLYPEVVTDIGSTGDQTWYFTEPQLTLQVDEPLRYFVFSQGGTLSTGTGAFKVPFTSPGTIKTVKAAVGTAPTGAEITLDVNKNSTTIYGSTSVSAPAISTDATIGANADPDPTTMAVGDWLTIDIDQVGSGTAGEDLTVVVEWRAE